jgi:flagellar biosynthesis protein FliQ
MGSDTALQLVGSMLRLGLLLCLPILGVVLLVGLAISVIQVVTQIQDPSIAFVPKLIVFVVALVLLAPWMLGKVVAFATDMFTRLPNVV